MKRSAPVAGFDIAWEPACPGGETTGRYLYTDRATGAVLGYLERWRSTRSTFIPNRLYIIPGPGRAANLIAYYGPPSAVRQWGFKPGTHAENGAAYRVGNERDAAFTLRARIAYHQRAA